MVGDAHVHPASGAAAAEFVDLLDAAVPSSAATRRAERSCWPLRLPPPPPQQLATLTVAATGRSGERVTSAPAGINVSTSSSGSISFGAGTSVTLSVTNGRDAIWSGACSSGDRKTRSCTFTLNGDATVNASVQ